MKEIEKEYTKYGYKFRQVKREGLVAIYQQVNEDTDEVIAHEVFIIQQLPEGFVGPRKYFQPAREVPPNSEQWGRNGWTIRTISDAEEKFEELVRRVAQRIEVAKEQ